MIYTAVANLRGTLRSVQTSLVRNGVTRLDVEIEHGQSQALLIMFDEGGEITLASAPPQLDLDLAGAIDGCAEDAFEYVRRTD